MKHCHWLLPCCQWWQVSWNAPQVWTKSTQGSSLQRVNEVWGLKTDGQPECLRQPFKGGDIGPNTQMWFVSNPSFYSKPVDWNMHKISMSCPCVWSLSDFGYCMRWITLISAHGLKINHILPHPMTKGSNSEFFQNLIFIDLGYCLYDLHMYKMMEKLRSHDPQFPK